MSKYINLVIYINFKLKSNLIKKSSYLDMYIFRMTAFHIRSMIIITEDFYLASYGHTYLNISENTKIYIK